MKCPGSTFSSFRAKSARNNKRAPFELILPVMMFIQPVRGDVPSTDALKVMAVIIPSFEKRLKASQTSVLLTDSTRTFILMDRVCAVVEWWPKSVR